MKFNAIDPLARDVPAAALFFHDAVGPTLAVNEEGFAEIKRGTMTLILSSTAMAAGAERIVIDFYRLLRDKKPGRFYSAI